jgi:hypothetical protein
MGKTTICGLICILGAGVAWAQINSGAITGLVTDKTGAAIPDAEVSVINEETQVAQKAKSDRAGEFNAPYLPGGRYTVVVEKQGFSAYKQTGIALGSGEQARVDAQLQVGRLGTMVEVKAEAMSIQT